MALDLYSKATTDTLLAAKLDLAGGTMTGGLTLSASGIIFSDATYLTTAPAGSTLAADQLTAGVVAANPTAGPTASGDVLSFDGTNLVWGPGGGGGSVAWGSITGTVTDQTDLTSYISGLGYIGEAPIDGFPYVRKNGAWDINTAPVGSVNWGAIGGYLVDQLDLQSVLDLKLDSSTASTTYLALAGGAMTADATVTIAESTGDHDSEFAGWGLGVQLTSDTTKGTTVQFNGLDTYDGSSHMIVNPTGLTFPDSTIQTTAWTGSAPGPTVNQVSTGPYTLAVSDANNIVRCSGFGSSDYVYVPDDATAAIPVGSRITILADGINNLGVVASGSAFLLWNYGGPIYINNTNGGTAVKVAADTWFLMRP
jgi:hypothetical protein